MASSLTDLLGFGVRSLERAKIGKERMRLEMMMPDDRSCHKKDTKKKKKKKIKKKN